MMLLHGSQAHSRFRKQKLLRQIQSSHPKVQDIASQYCHFVKLVSESTTLGESQRANLQRLLQYGEPCEPIAPSDNTAFIVPRIGTISPWSTKASDIIHNCGLNEVERVERGVLYRILSSEALSKEDVSQISSHLHDPMTESVLLETEQIKQIFQSKQPQPLYEVPLLQYGKEALEEANQSLGLALSEQEIEYLLAQYQLLNKNPTDVELMMFAQVNSEHCRHKIFNANWVIDGEKKEHSLFAMIRETHRQNSKGTLVAYSDNSSVLEGSRGHRFFADGRSKHYAAVEEDIPILCKVETHNHPTAISPYPGAATGSGGEIRDEGATGRGSKPKAGLCGFTVSHLRIPNATQDWEGEQEKPARIASPLQIMIEGPIGAASFNNEFGRPNITGYFRTYEQKITDIEGRTHHKGYHKPIMLAGGLGNIRPQHVEKKSIPAGAKIIVLGGPAMLIGLGGGAASSVSSGQSSEALDFASVQRGNAEMQRRCQEVIDACCALGEDNPIISIHDVGAGGLCNALPELVGDSERGAEFQLRNVLNDEMSMTPMQIWCNEAQERYVLAIATQDLERFEQICQREKSLFCVVGEATQEQQLRLNDSHYSHGGERERTPIDLPMSTLFANPPKMLKQVESHTIKTEEFDTANLDFSTALTRVLSSPTVADKTFLISIGDRSVTGLIARDQMVGQWQVPVADVAVSLTDHFNQSGEAMAMGERTPLAVINAPASGRMAIAESLTNLFAANIRDLSEVKLSANWMAAAGHEGDDAALYETVKAVGLELCPQLGISIPVGKDSMSMKTMWQAQGEEKSVVAPVSCVISAFAPVSDVDKTLTPEIQAPFEQSSLYFIDLSKGHARLAGSILAQVHQQVGQTCPDVEDADHVKRGLLLLKKLVEKRIIRAYHDRSDGGLLVTLLEMAFASRCALEINLSSIPGQDTLTQCFNEELGVVVQVPNEMRAQFLQAVSEASYNDYAHEVAQVHTGDNIHLHCNGNTIAQLSRTNLHLTWSNTTYQMQSLRDNPECAQQEYDRILDQNDTGLFANVSFDINEDISQKYHAIHTDAQPKVAILREQGVNSHIEMAAAFSQAGFAAVDVTMSDLFAQRTDLSNFKGLIACGGFSYGDVLGAGQGWAKSILLNPNLAEQFSRFFARQDTFTLGVCNGCQMLASLKELIPGAEHWPQFVHNKSEQYEARLVQIEVPNSNSLFFNGMQGSQFPVVVAHAEGRAQFKNTAQQMQAHAHVTLRYIDYNGEIATKYPANPNGSPEGIAGLSSVDGRATILMPHPERVYRSCSHSWHPNDWGKFSPWMRIFRNARQWLD